MSVRDRDDAQARPAEIIAEREARRAIEQRGHDDERDRATERETVIPAVATEDLFCFSANSLTVTDDMKPRLDVVEEPDGSRELWRQRRSVFPSKRRAVRRGYPGLVGAHAVYIDVHLGAILDPAVTASVQSG